MKPNRFIVLAVSVLALTGCSSTPTNVNTGAIHARTFNFVDRKTKPAPNFAVDNTEAVHTMIQSAITKNLAGRGVTRVPSGGDVTVAYLIIKGDNVSTTSISDYFGYRGDDYAHLQDIAHDRYMAHKDPNHFEAGTLLIDIIDGKSFKLLKRGYATRNLSSGPRATLIREAVDEILRDAPFEQ
jgi:hypothetical protein